MKLKFSLGLALITLICGLLFFFRNADPLFHQRDQHHEFVLIQGHHAYGFDLVDPIQAPANVRSSVIRGYHILMDTPFYAPQYTRSQLSCTNCHFSEGDTLGGKNGSFSLVGVTTAYPSFSPRSGRVITLAQRINNCFERSLNGKPLPVGSQEMDDIIAYLTWISKEVTHLKNLPWLGFIPLKSHHNPDPVNGKQIYQATCAACHGTDGEGGGKLPPPVGKTIPPLWGQYSFNDGAGMSNLSTLAAFIHWNMPYQQASLTEDQSLDVAAFVLEQPRPHFFQINEGDTPKP